MAKRKMRTIRIRESVAGPDFSFYPGQVVDVEEREAAALIKCGHAEPHVERATSKRAADATKAARARSAPGQASK